ncbi:MAG: associated Golgi protein-related protein [Bacteroidetes bacterium]|nr:associated Golgi protein-related protein [Bacteroidota bacterium]
MIQKNRDNHSALKPDKRINPAVRRAVCDLKFIFAEIGVILSGLWRRVLAVMFILYDLLRNITMSLRLNFVKKTQFLIPVIIGITFCFFVLSGVSVKAANTPQPEIAAADTLSFIQHIEDWYKSNTNYFSITVLMACESSVLPVPSEMVIPPAVYVAMDPSSNLSIFWIIMFGTIGALIGATFNYLMSRWLGRLVVYKIADSKVGKVLMLSSEKIKKSENYFNDHGKTSTFIGRFIPVIRHLISIPAGLAKMNYLTFAFYTFVGAGLWNCCLALLGYLAHGQQDMINKYSHQLSYVFLVVGAILLIWIILKTIKKKKTSGTATDETKNN